MSYSIKVLADKEFDRLPYSRVREAFGVTSPDKRNIYVRYTNVHDFNKMLVNHEMDHLVEEVPTDEGPDGERYFLGGLLSGLTGFLTKTAAPAIGKFFTSTIPTAAKSIGSNLYGGAQKLGSGVMNMFGSGAQKTISPFSGQNPYSPVMSSGWNNTFNSPRLPNITTAYPGIGNTGTTRLMQGFGQQAPQQILQNVPKKQGILSKFGSSMKDNPVPWLGAGMLGASFLKPKPQVPELPDSVNEIGSLVRSGGTGIGQLAQGKLTDLLNQSFNPMSEAEIQAALYPIEQQRKADLQTLNDQFKNARPGFDPLDDSAYQKSVNDINESYNRQSSQEVARRTSKLKSEFDKQKLLQIASAQGMSEQEIQYLMDLSEAEISRLMALLQIDQSADTNIREVLQNLGTDFLTSGLGFNQYSPLDYFGGQP